MKDIVLGVIPARGGSKRVYKKNIKLLGNRPLIAWTIDAAKESKMLDAFLVSTNDDEIASVAKKYGALTPFKRPDKISEDVDTVFALQHAIEWYEKKHEGVNVTHCVCLQPTSPFRTGADIDECIRIAKTTNVESVVSFKKATEHPLWMFELKPYCHEMVPYSNIELEGDNLVVQNLPLLFYPNGAVYVTRKDIIMEGKIYGNKIYGYLMAAERSIDLEEELDFMVAEVSIPFLAKKEPFVKRSWDSS